MKLSIALSAALLSVTSGASDTDAKNLRTRSLGPEGPFVDEIAVNPVLDVYLSGHVTPCIGGGNKKKNFLTLLIKGTTTGSGDFLEDIRDSTLTLETVTGPHAALDVKMAKKGKGDSTPKCDYGTADGFEAYVFCQFQNNDVLDVDNTELRLFVNSIPTETAEIRVKDADTNACPSSAPSPSTP